MATIDHSGKLTAIQVKQAKPKDKNYKLSDAKGLNLEVRSNGSKYWRLSYRYQQKQKTLAVGVYPVVTLAEARQEALKAKRLLRKGIDPNIHKRQQKAISTNNTHFLLSIIRVYFYAFPELINQFSVQSV